MGLQRFITVVRGTSTSRSVTYLTEYALRAAAALPSFKSLEGVEAWHVCQDPGGGISRLFVYWASRDHFVRDGPALESLLQAKVASHGYVGDVSTKEVPWWKRIKPTTALLSLAALLGAAEVISNRYERLFSSPDILLRPDRAHFDVVEGGEFVATLQVVNQLSIEQTDVDIGVDLVPSTGQRRNLSLSANRLSHLAASAVKEIKAVCVAPDAGSYKLDASAVSKAGLLKPRARFESSADVIVWPKLPVATVSLRRDGGRTAAMAGTLLLGPPALNGLDCSLTIEGVEGLTFEGLLDLPVANSKPAWNTAGAGSSSVAMLRWAMAPIPDGKQKLDLELVMARNGPTDWKSIARNARLACQYRKEKFST